MTRPSPSSIGLCLCLLLLILVLFARTQRVPPNSFIGNSVVQETRLPKRVSSFSSTVAAKQWNNGVSVPSRALRAGFVYTSLLSMSSGFADLFVFARTPSGGWRVLRSSTEVGQRQERVQITKKDVVGTDQWVCWLVFGRTTAHYKFELTEHRSAAQSP